MERVWSNADLKRLIFSFGYPEHRVYMKTIVDAFQHETTRRNHLMDCLGSDFRLYRSIHNDNGWMEQMLCDLLTEDEQGILLHTMIDCRCCSYHSHGKPVHNLLWVYENQYYIDYHLPWINPLGPARGDCKCKCKTLSKSLLCCLSVKPTLQYRDNALFITPTEMR